MANVWYIGDYEVREIFGQRFDKHNGWSVSEANFTSPQLVQLNADKSFLLGQVAGPRTLPFKADSINGPDAYLKAMQDTLAASEAIQADIPGRLSAEALENQFAARFATYQAYYLGQAMRKLRTGAAVKIVARGDSITYGHDTVSGDAVAAPTTTLPDGSKHSFTRSPAPWPSVLQGRLEGIYGSGKVIVENQGYSGDWVQRSYNRWAQNPTADVTLISFGTNDHAAEYVPEGIRGNVREYIWWIEKMILRDITWGSAVVLLAPMRQRGPNGNASLDAFRNAVFGLGTAYGIPVVDSEELLITAPWDCWSDGNHLTTKGNNIVGSRLAALFVGEGPLKKKVVGPGAKMLGRPTLDNVTYSNGAWVCTSTGYPTPRDTAAEQGIAAGLSSQPTQDTVFDGEATWSFYTEQPDVVLVPYSYIYPPATGETSAKITYELDFGIEQGQNYHVEVANSGQAGNGDRAWNSTVHGPLVYGNAASYRNDPVTNPLSLRVATPGWHTIRAKYSRTNNQTLTLTHMWEAFDWRTLQQMKKPVDFSGMVSSLQAVHVPVPLAMYDESTDITQTKVYWPGLVQALGVRNWFDRYFAAPLIEVTVRTYGIGWVKYAFLCTQRTDAASIDIAARNVDTQAATESGAAINFVKKLGTGATISTGSGPEAAISGRELQSIGYEAATQSLVFNWKTTNTSDGAAKNLKKNFMMSFNLF